MVTTFISVHHLFLVFLNKETVTFPKLIIRLTQSNYVHHMCCMRVSSLPCTRWWCWHVSWASSIAHWRRCSWPSPAGCLMEDSDDLVYTNTEKSSSVIVRQLVWLFWVVCCLTLSINQCILKIRSYLKLFLSLLYVHNKILILIVKYW